MAKKILIPFFLLFPILFGFGQFSNNTTKLNWNATNPFEQKVFIENNEGQFDRQLDNDSDKILFSSTIDGIVLFFTSSGITYRYDEPQKLSGEQREELEKEGKEQDLPKPISRFFSCIWKGANTENQIIGEDEASFYYCYPINNNHTTIAHAFRKLLYKNLYAGIDIEYSFPENKEGIEYVIIIHPNADISKVKLFYKNAKSIKRNANGDIKIQSSFGTFTDHAPNKTSYKEDSEIITSTSSLNEDELTFSAGNYDKSKTLIIDPWTTDPGFGTYDAAYSVRYDLEGNVYAYGGGNANQNINYQLAKFNGSGGLQWLVNTNFNERLGDITVDEYSQSVYITGAFSGVAKINSSGIQTNFLNVPGPSDEEWKIAFDYCNHALIIGGGGTQAVWQAAIIDTNLSAINTVNILGATEPTHDIALLTLDEVNGYCYMATARSLIDDPGNFNNTLVKCPLNLSSAIFSVSDGYSFEEIESVKYVANNPIGGTNGFNGMTVTQDYLFTYDGATLKQFNKNSGALIKGLSISKTPFDWGGLDADNCGNIYLGNTNEIAIYDSILNKINTLPMAAASDTIYDIRVGPNNLLYVCGKGFISSYTIPNSTNSITKKSSPSCSGCNGTALIYLNGCNTNAIKYKWSNGATTQFVTNLCPGTYNVTASLGCEPLFSDTINIPSTSTPSINIPNATIMDVSCYNGDDGKAVALASGGTAPYTYIWFPSNQINQDASNLTAGTYTLFVTDSYGCGGIDTVIITQPSQLYINGLKNITIKAGDSTTLNVTLSGGTPPYSYTWNGNYTGASFTVSPLVNTTYTVVGTDNNGCEVIGYVTIDVVCGDIFVPNAFSPDNSIRNNILYVRSPCISTIDFMVFDRWGNKVFESTNINKGWSGEYNGAPMNMGTYIWCLKATLYDGTNIEKKGNVTLVR